jgi:solute carrier family 25 carnitine/acylcarnitine transporter 20/29
MFFRASLFGAFGEAKRWLAKNPDGSTRTLAPVDFYKVGQTPGQ